MPFAKRQTTPDKRLYRLVATPNLNKIIPNKRFLSNAKRYTYGISILLCGNIKFGSHGYCSIFLQFRQEVVYTYIKVLVKNRDCGNDGKEKLAKFLKFNHLVDKLTK